MPPSGSVQTPRYYGGPDGPSQTYRFERQGALCELAFPSASLQETLAGRSQRPVALTLPPTHFVELVVVYAEVVGDFVDDGDLDLFDEFVCRLAHVQ